MLASLEDARVSRHKCLIYDGHPSEQLPVIVPLLREGLESRHRCLYLGAPDSVSMVRDALAKHGIDADAEVARGALILSSDRSHLKNGMFDPRAMVTSIRTMIDEAVSEGFAGLCATGDMRWELGDDDRSFDRLLEYESLLEQVFREKPLMGICQYHRDVIPSHAVRDALLTHRSTYMGDTLNRDNIFYVPPELVLESRTSVNPAKHGEWMYQQITRVLRAEAARDRALDALRKSEALLAEANRDLERRVRERTSELEAANAHLEAFSYSVSHDLRAPVRAVKGFSEILTEDFSEGLGAEGLDYVNRMHAGAEKMENLIEGLLVLGRAMKLPMTRETVDVASLARDVALEVTESTGRKNVRLVVHSPLSATGDAALLRVALVNMMSNAWKFTARKSEPQVEIGSAGTIDGMVTLYVRDNGAGFDSTRSTHLFSAFHRMHSDKEFEGTGIGLATVHRVVQRHGGKIWAESRPGEGATFYFTIPV